MPLRWRGGSKSLTKVSGSDQWVQCTLYTHVRYPVSVRPLCNELLWKIYKQELNKTQRYAVSILVLDLIYVDTTKT